MRRIQIYIDGHLDDAAREEAARLGVSKAAFIRQCVERAVDFEAAAPDPWEALIGWLEGDPVEDLDEVIYGRTPT